MNDCIKYGIICLEFNVPIFVAIRRQRYAYVKQRARNSLRHLTTIQFLVDRE